MGLQIPHRICTQVSAEKAVRQISSSSWRDLARFMPAAWSGVVRRAFDAGPHPHVSKRAAQV